MISLNDLNDFAIGVEEKLKEILDETNVNLRDKVEISVRLPHSNMSEIDRQLYVINNGTDADFTPGDEVEITFYGIKFRIESED